MFSLVEEEGHSYLRFDSDDKDNFGEYTLEIVSQQLGPFDSEDMPSASTEVTVSVMNKCTSSAFESTTLVTPEPATWSLGLPNELLATPVEIKEGYRCGTYSYKLVNDDEDTKAVTDAFTVGISSLDESVVSITGTPAEEQTLSFKLCAVADDKDLMATSLEKIESDDITITVVMPILPVPDNSDTRIIFIAIFGSFCAILLISCCTAFLMGKCGKCQGEDDKTALYNNTEKK